MWLAREGVAHSRPDLQPQTPPHALPRGPESPRAWPTAVELRSRASNLNEPFNKLIAAVDDHRLINDGNPVLTWMAGNTLLKQVQGGDYIYPAKLVPEDKIDGIVALINALWPLSQVPEDTGNDDRRNSFFQALGMPQGA